MSALLGVYLRFADALDSVTPKGPADEAIRSIIARAPLDHPVHGTAATSLRCAHCGQLSVLIEVSWRQEQTGWDACCPHCDHGGGLELASLVGVAGHG